MPAPVGAFILLTTRAGSISLGTDVDDFGFVEALANGSLGVRLAVFQWDDCHHGLRSFYGRFHVNPDGFSGDNAEESADVYNQVA